MCVCGGRAGAGQRGEGAGREVRHNIIILSTWHHNNMTGLGKD